MVPRYAWAMFSGNIGPMELFIVLVIVLLIFGPKKLPGLGRQLGRGMREFKDSITGDSRDSDDDEAERPALDASAPVPETPAPPPPAAESAPAQDAGRPSA